MNQFILITSVVVCFCLAARGNLMSQEIRPSAELDATFSATMLAMAEREETELRLNRIAFEFLQKFDQSKPQFEHLELVPDQVEQLEKIRFEYSDKLTELKDDLSGSETAALAAERNSLRQQLRSEYSMKIREVLMDHQLKDAASSNPIQQGIVKAILSDGLVRHLELSELQQERIREKSNALARKIHDFIHEARVESYRSISSELNLTQLKKMQDFFGSDRVKQSFERRTLETVFIQSLIDPAKIPGLDKVPSPSHSFRQTTIDFKIE